MQLDSFIEAILFYKGEPVSIQKLSSILERPKEEIISALDILHAKLENRGLRLLQLEDEVTLGTSPKANELIEELTREELSKDLGKAGLETLSIVMYRGPISRRDIDFIRGVNSTFILRNLQIRGLVEKVPNPKDQRSFLYKTTFELLQHLGLEKIDQLPEYEKVRTEMEKRAKALEKEEEQQKTE